MCFTAQHVDDRALAGAIRPKEAEAHFVIDDHGQVPHRHQVAELLAQIADANGGLVLLVERRLQKKS